MSDDYYKLDVKLDKLSDKLDEIHLMLGSNTEVLKSHEKNIDDHGIALKELHKELEPLKNKFEQMNGVVKFFSGISMFVLIVSGVFGVLKYFKGIN